MGIRFCNYLHEQPETLERILSRPIGDMQAALELCGGAPEGILLIGSGSSYHAACAAAPFIRMLLQIQVECLTPSMAMSLPSLPAWPALAISQSGTSTSTLQVVSGLKAAGRPVLCVTAMPQSPVALEAGICLDILCGEEQVGPKTKGVSATLMTLLVFALALSRARRILPEEELAGFQRKLLPVPERVRAALQMGEAFFQDNKEKLSALNHVVCIAAAANMGVCAECALKLLETCWLPSFYYEMEEYMHGVHYTIGEGSTLFFLPDAAALARMQRLEGFALQHGVQSFWAAFPQENDVVAAFGAMAFFHAVCEGLSSARGIDCDIARYPMFGRHMETKTN